MCNHHLKGVKVKTPAGSQRPAHKTPTPPLLPYSISHKDTEADSMNKGLYNST